MFRTVFSGILAFSPRTRRGNNQRARLRRALLQRLESRCVMDGQPLISEFLAANSGGLRDADGDSSDWIEIYNPTSAPVDLEGWFLTDNPGDLNAWQLPSLTLAANDFVTIFASGKDRAVSGSELHTNFRLSTDGDYLALVQPSGQVASEYAPTFPPQVSNVSFGAVFETQTVIERGSQAQVLIPTNNNLGDTWTSAGFDTSSWTNGSLAMGYGLAQPGFEVTYVKANINITDLGVAEDVLADPMLQAEVVESAYPVVNFLGNGGSVHFVNDYAFPTQEIGDDYDDFLIEARAVISIPNPGQWTFGVNSDDGFSLTLEQDGVEFYTEFFAPRGPEDTLATFNIPSAGDWQARLVMYERGGGAEVEFFAAPGELTTFDAQQFRLVGDSANGGLIASFGVPIETDLRSVMQGINTSAYVHIPFSLESFEAADALVLDIQYDDGFVAYLNGTEVVRRNAPLSLEYNSAATDDRTFGEVAVTERISLTDYLPLLVSGQNALAIQVLNSSANDDSLLIQPILSLVTIDTDQPRYFASPTPNEPNADPFLGVVDRVDVSVAAGFYDEPFQVSLSTATAGATVKYTLDGSTPTVENGQVYSSPLLISETSTLRAGAFLTDYVSLPTVSRTYLFLEDVISQAADGQPPVGWPSTWGNNVVDYGMDADIISQESAEVVRQALLAIPTLAVSTDLGNLFDDQFGIYSSAQSDGREWERPASLELLNPDGSAGFQVNAGIRIRGGYSRSNDNPKHSFRFFFRGEYGDGSLDYPMFGTEGVQSFKKLDLRTAQNYSWSFGGDASNTFIADVFARETQRDMDQPYTRSRWYHLYIDGQYWGLYQTQERAEAEFAASYFGGAAADYDVLKPEAGPYIITATDGNDEAYRRLWESAVDGFGADEDYLRVQGKNPDGSDNLDYEVLLDVENLQVYMINILYGGNLDAPISAFLGNSAVNNFFAVRDRTGRDGFKFFLHDSEHTLLPWGLNENRNGPYSAGEQFQHFNPQWLHQQLMANPEYRISFADQVQASFFGDGPLTVAAAQARYQAHIEQLDLAIIAESARWGDAKRPNDPLDREDWLNAAINVRDNYLTQRGDIVLDQWRAIDLFPSINAPAFLVNGNLSTGGFTEIGSNLRFAATGGLVYYLLDGTDPRLPGGAIHPEALVYDPTSEPTTLVPTESQWKYFDQGIDLGTAWKAGPFDDSGWAEGDAELGYGDGDEATLVNFGPNAANKYITTYFRKTFQVDDAIAMTGLRLRLKRDDGAVVYLNGSEVVRTNMPSGTVTYATLASNAVGGADETTFYEFSIDPALLVTGLNSLAIEIHQSSSTSSDISFDAELIGDSQLNPGLTIDSSISLVARALSPSGEWSAKNEAVFNTAVPATVGALVITEIMYNPLAPSVSEPALDKEEFEFVEFRNVSDQPISLVGVQFSAGINFDFNSGSISYLNPGQNVIVARNLAAFRGRYGDDAIVAGTYGSTGTNLSNGGETITVVDSLGTVLQSFTYDDVAPWPTSPDGGGTSLTMRWIDRSDDLPTNWRASYVPLGTPGYEENDYPENLSLSSNSVNENSLQAVIGIVSAEDPNGNEGLFFELRPEGDASLFTLVGNELRIGSTALDFEQGATRSITIRATDAGGLFVDFPLTINVNDLPEVDGVVVGDGTLQRSLVKQLVVTFDGEVEIDPDAFLVVKRGPQGGTVLTSFATSINGQGQTVATISFSGDQTRGLAGALIDGSYQLTIDPTKVRRGSMILDGDSNGVDGGLYNYGTQSADRFFALFGDMNGDRSVSLGEFSQLRGAFGRSVGDPGYREEFDYDGNGVVSLADFNQFRSRFGRLLAFE